MKKQLYRAAAATVLGLSLTTGVVAADTGDISHSGTGSANHITNTMTNTNDVRNRNNLDATNLSAQFGASGDATSNRNTAGGDATTGDVSNSNSLDATVAVDNSSAGAMTMPGAGMGGAGSIDNSGTDSSNTITDKTTNTNTVQNTNNLAVTNVNMQMGTSGSATSSRNTNGGSATTGSVTNTSTSSFTFDVKN